MVIAAEFTTATLVAWVLIGLAVGFIVGWLLRPWLVGDRLREEYETQLEALGKQLEVTKAELADVTAGLAEASTDREAARADVVRLESELAGATARTIELEREVETQGLEKDAEIERLATDAGKVGALETRLTELEDASTGLEASQAEVARLKAELEAASGKAAAAESAAARIAEKNAELEQSQASAAEVRAQVTTLQDDDSAERVAELQVQLEACRTAVADRDRTIAELEAAATSAEAEAAPSVEAAVVAAAPPVAAVPEDAASPAPDKETATRKVAEIAVRTRGGGPHVNDNLRRIHGIGPKIAGLLRDMDITSFRQIARFEPEDIAYVAAALEAFPDRIDRDDWMSSAARLHEEKYGEPA